VKSFTAAVAFALLLSAPGPLPAADDGIAHSLVAVRVVSGAGQADGTAVLVRRDDRVGVTSLSFLTSAHLFRGLDDELDLSAATIQLRLDEGHAVDIKRQDVAVGKGQVNVAVLHVAIAHAPALEPIAVVYDHLPVGASFSLAAVDESGRMRIAAEHVRFRSTLLVMGDRDASELVAWRGAPAIAPEGIIGFVRDCEQGRPAVISLLSPARAFIERHMPRP
jgi:hypothetical protein